jgi:hypothetical protein
MTVTIDNAYIKTFESYVRHVAQQTDARLRPFVTEKQSGGEDDSFPIIGTADFTSKASSRTATPMNDTAWSNRICNTAVYHQGDSYEPEDVARMIVEPQSNLVQAIGNGARRCIDDIIIAAFSATADDKDGNHNALPSDSKLGGATQAFDFNFVTDLNEWFLARDIPTEEEKCLCVSPNCAKMMLREAKATSEDYVGPAHALVNGGFIRNFLGFTWVVSNRLPLAVGGTLQRYVYAFTKRAMGLKVTKDIWARIAEDPTHSFMTVVYSALDMGAVRIEDKRIVQAHILEA